MARRSLVSIEDDGGDRWYFSRKEIEENSPSRRDGIDLTKETYFRKSYCTFLQELGMRLKVPQITIATATIFCHRFFLRQSHGKHNRRTIATVCFFLASKVEETPRPLRNVIVLSYEIIHKKDPETVRRIFKQEGVFEQQKKLILQGEKLVLAFLDFDLSVCHPYKPLVEAIRKFKVADPNALAQVAWNFVNDGLRMTLCLQFKPHEIAAGAIFLAAKFLKLKLPSDGQKAWWQVLAVTPSQLEEVSNQMLELYEQNRMPRPSQAKASEAECRPPSKVLADGENARSGTGPVFSRSIVDQANADNHLAPVRVCESQNKNCTNSEMHHTSECKGDGEINDNQQSEQQQFPHQGNVPEIQNTSRIDFDPQCQQEQEKIAGRMEALEAKHVSLSQPPLEAVKKKVENKVKAALEKRRKLGPDASRKEVFMDEDEMIEMQLENGIELY